MTSAARARMLAIVAVYSLLWAGLCNFALEAISVGGLGEIHRAPGAPVPRYILGALVVWVVLLILLALTGRLWVSLALLLSAAIGLGMANHDKLAFRQEPLYPSDVDFLRDPGFLFQMVSPLSVAVAVLALIAIVVGGVAAGRLASRAFPRVSRREEPRLWRRVLAARGLAVVLAVGFLVYAAHFNSTGNEWRRVYEANGAQWRFWYQKLNYSDNGFVGGFLYNLNVPAMTEPAGYSQATMRRIALTYSKAAAQLNQDRSAHALDGVNVVLVLSEAFSDPTRLHGLSPAQDPIPRTRGLMKQTTSGRMLAQLYGGGTANMEFETLTGQSLAQFEPQMSTPYQMLVSNYASYPSAVGHLAKQGHQPIAIHPYMTSMYKREQVYPVLGFDRFIHDTTMQEARKIEHNDFISDASAFHEAQYQIQHARSPLLVNLVTMQNHVPMADDYSDPIHVAGLRGGAENEGGNYARGIAHTDQALSEFLGHLKKSHEKTVVVFYGDHLPGIWPDSVQKQNSYRTMHETPYFVWNNFQAMTPDPQPTTSPIYFMPLVYDMVGASLPPYYALLEELHDEIPAMEQDRYIDARDQSVKEADLSPRARQLLHDYRLVQYDFSVGKRYAVSSMFPQTTAPSSLSAQGR